MHVYQPYDKLDMDIEELTLLMVNMSHRRHEERMNNFISRANRQNSERRNMTKKDCRSKASGALQHKIWKPGELKMKKSKQHDEMDDQLQHKVWDLSILKMEGYDQEVIFLSS